MIGTAFLVGFIFAITDEFNAPVKSNLAPLIVGFIVVAIGISFGANAGYAINPARDFGPRLWAWIAGWKSIAFPGDYGNVNTYFWIPIVGPLVGAAVGALVYDLGIRNVLIARGAKPDPEMVEEGRRDVTRRTQRSEHMPKYIGAIDQGTTSSPLHPVRPATARSSTSISASTSRSIPRRAGSSTTPRRSGRGPAR